MLDGERASGERSVPSWLRPILRRGLALDPAARFPSMRAVVRTLAASPARRKRRLLVAAGLTLALASSALTLASLDTLAHDRCAEAEAELRGVWDPSLRAAARTAFAKLELANADEVWQRLEPRIDDYARAWVTSREQSCRGRLGSVTLSPELASLRDACLARRRAELGGLTELLVSADRETVLAALDAVDRLTPIASCDDLESLGREASLADTHSPDAVEPLRQEVLRRTTQVRAGHGRELELAADQLIERARILAAPGPLAEALVLRALVEEAHGRYDAAAATLEAGALEAVAARHDRLHAEIAVRLVWMHGVRRRDLASARAWVDRADAAIRASRADLVLRARLLDHRGAIAGLEHDHPGAERLHREALALYSENEPQANAELPAILGNLGSAVLAQDRPREAIPLIEQSLERYRERFGPSHPDVAAVLSNLGQAQILAGEHERGLATLHEALALKQRVLGPKRSR